MMGLQAIEATPKDGKPVFLVDQDTGDMTAAHWAARQGVSFQTEGTSIAFSATHWRLGRKTGEGLRRVIARASVIAEVCVLWLFIGAIWDNGLCGESKTRAQAVVAPTEKGPKIAQPNAMRDESLLVSRAVETKVIEQKQILERGREKVDVVAGRLTPIPIQQLEEAQGKASQSATVCELGAEQIVGLEPVQSAEAETKQRQTLDQQRDRTETLERELSSLRAEVDSAWIAGSEAADAFAGALSSLRAELDAARNVGSEVVQAAEAEIKQKHALKQERGRADALARELSSLRAELDTARKVGPEVAQAAAAEIKQKQALKQEQDRADALARELSSLRAELDAARKVGSEVAQAAEADIKQKRALKQERDRADALARELTSLRAESDTARAAGQEAARTAEAAKIKQELALKQERDRGEALARELTSLRAELDAARAAGLEAARTAEAAKIEQDLAVGKQREKTETLARELASARKEVGERSALLAAAHAEVLQVTETNSAIATEQKLALARERDRADALTRELTSVKNELEAANRQIAALNASGAVRLREPAAASSQERRVESSLRTIAGKERSAEQISGEAVALTSGRSSASELPRPEARSTSREAASDSDPKVAMATERSASTSAASRPLVDEQRLLARANALLLQADISGARPLLEHALERGSARAAFMLAETYDARVSHSWGARGIAGNLAKAREFYEWAQAGGIEDAKERIKTLK